jgi:hypothetical protein
MRPWTLNSTLLALALSACAESEPPVFKFETVTIDLTQSTSQLGGNAPRVPLPARKPAQAVAAEISTAEPTSFVPRMPNLRQITACDSARDATCPGIAP